MAVSYFLGFLFKGKLLFRFREKTIFWFFQSDEQPQ